MLTEFKKFKGWVVLEYFLKNPIVKIHIKKLARELKIGNYTAQHYLAVYEKDGTLSSEKIGNLKQYSLNNEVTSVQSLKKFYFLQKLSELTFSKQLIDDNPSISSIVLYGSYANGTYSDKSDIDLLIISNEKINQESLRKLESEFGKEVGLTVYTIGEWRSLIRKGNNFVLSVIKNNVVLYGAEI